MNSAYICNMKPSIELKGLTTGYRGRNGETVIERNLSACLSRGEFTCLLGPNGAGKTTLLRTLSGFLPPLEGSIVINGREMQEWTETELSRQLSVVLTERPSVTSMTVEQLVGIGRSPYTGFWGRLTDHDRKVVEEAMRLTGITSMKDRNVDTLSDGERQKVMIAKSLAQETPVIFLDEPTAFLDFPSKVEMMRLLRKLAKEEGKTVFQSTHDLNMALRLADRLWLVDKELGMRTGTPGELAESGDLERYFLRDGIFFDHEAMTFRIKA